MAQQDSCHWLHPTLKQELRILVLVPSKRALVLVKDVRSFGCLPRQSKRNLNPASKQTVSPPFVSFPEQVPITNPRLRAWMGLRQGEEATHDVQVSLTRDPLTLQKVYCVSQVRSRVLGGHTVVVACEGVWGMRGGVGKPWPHTPKPQPQINISATVAAQREVQPRWPLPQRLACQYPLNPATLTLKNPTADRHLHHGRGGARGAALLALASHPVKPGNPNSPNPQLQIDISATVAAQREVQAANARLAEEKLRTDALVQRQYNLITCLGRVSDIQRAHSSPNASTHELINAVRRKLTSSAAAKGAGAGGGAADEDDIELLEVLGVGSVSAGQGLNGAGWVFQNCGRGGRRGRAAARRTRATLSCWRCWAWGRSVLAWGKVDTYGRSLVKGPAAGGSAAVEDDFELLEMLGVGSVSGWDGVGECYSTPVSLTSAPVSPLPLSRPRPCLAPAPVLPPPLPRPGPCLAPAPASPPALSRPRPCLASYLCPAVASVFCMAPACPVAPACSSPQPAL